MPAKKKYFIYIFFFSLSLFSLLYFPAFFPHLNLLFFAPYLASLTAEFSPYTLLFQAILAGLCTDIFQTMPRFGLSPLSYLISASILFRNRHLFIPGHPLSLPLMTLLLSFTYRILFRITLFLLGISFPYKPHLLLDLIAMPLADSLFALLLFQLPFYFKKRKIEI